MIIKDVPIVTVEPKDALQQTNRPQGLFDQENIQSEPWSPAYEIPTNGGREHRDMNGLYRQVELKLESVIERLLLSKTDENDNLLASMQTVMERIFLTSAMRLAQGNISRAARILGINRNTLSRKLKAMEKTGRSVP